MALDTRSAFLAAQRKTLTWVTRVNPSSTGGYLGYFAINERLHPTESLTADAAAFGSGGTWFVSSMNSGQRLPTGQQIGLDRMTLVPGLGYGPMQWWLVDMIWSSGNFQAQTNSAFQPNSTSHVRTFDALTTELFMSRQAGGFPNLTIGYIDAFGNTVNTDATVMVCNHLTKFETPRGVSRVTTIYVNTIGAANQSAIIMLRRIADFPAREDVMFNRVRRSIANGVQSLSGNEALDILGMYQATLPLSLQITALVDVLIG